MPSLFERQRSSKGTAQPSPNGSGQPGLLLISPSIASRDFSFWSDPRSMAPLEVSVP